LRLVPEGWRDTIVKSGSQGPKEVTGAMTFRTPPEDRYFEDYIAGSVHEVGHVTVEQKEMIAFAKRFDPQVFHIDPVKAKESMFGGLIASGWYTASITMRVLVDNYVSHVASLGSPGVDALRCSNLCDPAIRFWYRGLFIHLSFGVTSEQLVEIPFPEDIPESISNWIGRSNCQGRPPQELHLPTLASRFVSRSQGIEFQQKSP